MQVSYSQGPSALSPFTFHQTHYELPMDNGVMQTIRNMALIGTGDKQMCRAREASGMYSSHCSSHLERQMHFPTDATIGVLPMRQVRWGPGLRRKNHSRSSQYKKHWVFHLSFLARNVESARTRERTTGGSPWFLPFTVRLRVALAPFPFYVGVSSSMKSVIIGPS
jgi:hypothetical protein